MNTAFNLKLSKSGGNRTKTKLITNFYEKHWKIKINEQSSWHFFLLWWVCRSRCKSKEKVKWALLHLWKCFFLLNNNFSQFNHAAYHIDTKHMIPGFVSRLFFGGGRGVYGSVPVLFRSTYPIEAGINYMSIETILIRTALFML